jgi:hypothetical protein
MRRPGTLPLFAALLVGVLHAAPATAQEPLSDVLSFLLTNQAVPTGDFEKDAAAAATTRDTMERLLLVELTTLPLASSSAGFSYRFNPTLGTLERATESFGPFFTERALTAGRGRVALGATMQFARYTTLDGFDLRDGSFVTTGNQFRDESQPFDVEALTLRLTSRTITFTANAGVADRVDLGVAVPLVSISMDGTRVNTYRGASLVQATAEADAAGVGDIAVRGKVRLLGDGDSGLAVVGEARLPTGREEDLLGSGETSIRGLLIASGGTGPVSLHANVGLTGGGLADEFTWRGAIAATASPSVTLIGELVGRRIGEAGRIVLERAAHPRLAGVDTLRLVTTGSSTSSASAVAGLKWNAGTTLLLNANVIVPLTDDGLQSTVTALVGLEYSFGR